MGEIYITTSKERKTQYQEFKILNPHKKVGKNKETI